MKSVFISVVIPTFNRPAILEQCLESLEKVDYPRDEFEVIVVNDGGAAPRTRRTDVDLTVLSQPNRGPAAARNAGVARAAGQFVAFLDDDCRVPRDWLKSVTSAIRKSPDAMIGGRTINALADNRYSAASQSVVDYVYSYYDGSAGRPRFFASNNFSVKADLFWRIGGFDEHFRAAEDRDFCRRWNAAGLEMIYDDSVVVMHAHDLGAGSLHKQHFTYGRGAYPFWKRVSQSGERFRIEPLSFYTGILSAPFSAHNRSAPLTAMLTFTMQVANAAGFFFEMARSSLLSSETVETNNAQSRGNTRDSNRARAGVMELSVSLVGRRRGKAYLK
jgi:GT2 family glycosyltransferase